MPVLVPPGPMQGIQVERCTHDGSLVEDTRGVAGISVTEGGVWGSPSGGIGSIGVIGVGGMIPTS